MIENDRGADMGGAAMVAMAGRYSHTTCRRSGRELC